MRSTYSHRDEAVSSPALGIAGMGIASSIGIGKDAVARALFAGTRGLIPRDDLIPGRTVHVGGVTGPLPPVPRGLESMECRNGRLMLASVAEINRVGGEAADRFGRDRIGRRAGNQHIRYSRGRGGL